MAKVKPNRFGKCALCKVDKTLCDSHIIPELFYSAIYNQDNVMVEVSVRPDTYAKHIRKGHKQYLLCRECEDIIQKYEDEAKRIRDDATLTYDSMSPYERLFVMHGMNYQKFKLFQLSVLWRMSVSTLDMFDTVDLGPYNETLRLMVLNGDPGDVGDFPCFMARHSYKGKHATNFLIAPIRMKFTMEHTGVNVAKYVVGFGGMKWTYFVTTADKVQPNMLQLFLQKNGDFMFQHEEMTDNEGIQRSFRAMVSKHQEQQERKRTRWQT